VGQGVRRLPAASKSMRVVSEMGAVEDPTLVLTG
jgi:hypothetical protein